MLYNYEGSYFVGKILSGSPVHIIAPGARTHPIDWHYTGEQILHVWTKYKKYPNSNTPKIFKYSFFSCCLNFILIVNTSPPRLGAVN